MNLPQQHHVSFYLRNKKISYEIIGDVEHGLDEVLLEQDDNLIQGQTWDPTGYTIAPFLEEPLRKALVAGITLQIKKTLEQVTGHTLPQFTLEHYHQFVDDELHKKICQQLYMTDTFKFPIDFQAVTQKVSEICGIPLTPWNPRLKNSVYCMRIVRPQKYDNNPLHKDVWIDTCRNALNTYIPICASNENSSLPLIPGSHYWKESDVLRTKKGSTVNSVHYTVPAVISTKYSFSDLMVPDPKPNEILLFSPYLIHGSAVNDNELTRVSLEIRFWRANID